MGSFIGEANGCREISMSDMMSMVFRLLVRVEGEGQFLNQRGEM